MNIDAKFEKISKYADDSEIIIPFRKTSASAGYDFYCAEDTIIPSYMTLTTGEDMARTVAEEFETQEAYDEAPPSTLAEAAARIKKAGSKITLVPTGIKCKIPEDHFLQLSVRSSLPLKHWLILGNGVGIIDADYYNNPDNEGHIYFQLINLMPFDIVIKKGECFGQGILLPYCTTEDDHGSDTVRSGGFGSTNE